jgi:hypothetical protein
LNVLLEFYIRDRELASNKKSHWCISFTSVEYFFSTNYFISYPLPAQIEYVLDVLSGYFCVNYFTIFRIFRCFVEII